MLRAQKLLLLIVTMCPLFSQCNLWRLSSRMLLNCWVKACGYLEFHLCATNGGQIILMCYSTCTYVCFHVFRKWKRIMKPLFLPNSLNGKLWLLPDKCYSMLPRNFQIIVTPFVFSSRMLSMFIASMQKNRPVWNAGISQYYNHVLPPFHIISCFDFFGTSIFAMHLDIVYV
jgi:hypothetical protein